MMRRKFAVVVLTLGTVFGYAAGFASLKCHHQARRQMFENHVAKICVDAARGADAAR